MKKEIITIVFFLFLLELVLAQEAKIDIENSGFGKTPKEVFFTIHNVGTVKITNPTVYIDGKEYEKTSSSIAPNGGYEVMYYLEPGEHLIEVRTPEGAYDSVKITVSLLPEKPYKPPEETKSFLEENIMIIGLVALVIIIVIIVWLFTRKPRLKL
ncbi:MAG: hypothetical protein NTW30_04520 [Candidatus Aenigmarchaeota archaeon]|nr:hypothetical protein [Candidatus Aenigmarchaeota archaeon]